MNCIKDHSDLNELLESMPQSSSSRFVNKCPACAFELGFSKGLNNCPEDENDIASITCSSPVNDFHLVNCELCYSKGWEIGHKIFSGNQYCANIQATLPLRNKKNGVVTHELLKLYRIHDKYIVGVFSGSLSDYDMLIKYWRYDDGNRRWPQPRQPKHIHWAVDVLLKNEHDHELIFKFMEQLLKMWDTPNIITPLCSNADRMNLLNPDNLLKKVYVDAELYQNYQICGEYPIEFLILIARILMVQEKTNYPGAYMFRKLLASIKSAKDIYTVVSHATFNRGR